MNQCYRICIVASCPGGVASNVVTFLANADVPLSVAMTTVSTLAAVVTTPLITRALVGTLVPVDPAALLISTLQVSSTHTLHSQDPPGPGAVRPYAELSAGQLHSIRCRSLCCWFLKFCSSAPMLAQISYPCGQVSVRYLRSRRLNVNHILQ